jgi:hypothetical protein
VKPSKSSARPGIDEEITKLKQKFKRELKEAIGKDDALVSGGLPLHPNMALHCIACAL